MTHVRDKWPIASEDNLPIFVCNVTCILCLSVSTVCLSRLLLGYTLLNSLGIVSDSVLRHGMSRSIYDPFGNSPEALRLLNLGPYPKMRVGQCSMLFGPINNETTGGREETE